MRFIHRKITPVMRKLASAFPVLSLSGPRQSGKTTLLKEAFSNKAYINFENLDERERFHRDPRSFMSMYNTPQGAIFDEAQRVPELFSYLQGVVDEKRHPGQFILSGSQNFLLSGAISQSLAGRVGIMKLLPLSCEEISRPEQKQSLSLWSLVHRGSYPELHQKDLDEGFWYPSYIETYVERDIRQLANVKDIELYKRFIKLLAGRTAQLINYRGVGNELGVDSKTIKSWMSLLHTSYLTFSLSPYHSSYNKRILKTPKLYFFDSGLVCHLLGIRTPEDLLLHPLRGEIFETWVMSEFMKLKYNTYSQVEYYFWQAKTRQEIDLLFEVGQQKNAVEIKSSSTVSGEFFKNIRYFRNLEPAALPGIIYGGERSYSEQDTTVTSWRDIAHIYEGQI